MAVVEDRQPPPSATTAYADEQVAELNELLVHVLDEISSLKEAMCVATRGVRKGERKKGKHRLVVEEERTRVEKVRQSRR